MADDDTQNEPEERTHPMQAVRFDDLPGLRLSPHAEPTQEQIDSICSKLAEGLHLDPAARLIGLDAKQARGWRRKGIEELASGQPGICALFVVRTEQAISECEAKQVNRVQRGARNVSAAMFMLERRFPGRWAPKTSEGGGGMIAPVSLTFKLAKGVRLSELMEQRNEDVRKQQQGDDEAGGDM